MAASASFKGFSKDSIVFLQGLKRHNDKRWFASHKPEYESVLLDPMRRLVSELADTMRSIDRDFEIDPLGNKNISRINRDTRFSRDKSPYKTSVWITFKRTRKDWKDRPAYFFEISPDSYRYGMGLYSATPETMRKFRKLIDDKPKEFREAVSFYSGQDVFVLEGENYKRPFDGAMAEEARDWYQRKNLYLVCNRKIDTRLFNRKLAVDMISGFRLLADLYRFLSEVG